MRSFGRASFLVRNSRTIIRVLEDFVRRGRSVNRILGIALTKLDKNRINVNEDLPPSSLVKISFVTAPNETLSRSSLQSASMRAVFPLPTGLFVAISFGRQKCEKIEIESWDLMIKSFDGEL